MCYRQAGDRNLLVEYGPLVLDLNLRFRVHALMEWVSAQQTGRHSRSDAGHPFFADAF